MTLVLKETGSSSSSRMRQHVNNPHRYDRKDIAFLLDKLATTLGQPTGTTEAELALLRFTLQQNLADSSNNDQTLSDMLPMVRAILEYTEASNKTDPRGYCQTAFYRYEQCSTRVGLVQREMVRSESSLQIPGEWFFDQNINLSCSTEPSFGLSFKTIIHGANDREPIVLRHAEFWMNGHLPHTAVASMNDKRFGDIMDSDGWHIRFIGHALDDWIIAKATNENDPMLENNPTFNLKLSHP